MKPFAEETSPSINFKEAFKQAQDKSSISVPETTLAKVQALWRDVFPKRDLAIDKNRLFVKSSLATEKEQKALTM